MYIIYAVLFTTMFKFVKYKPFSRRFQRDRPSSTTILYYYLFIAGHLLDYLLFSPLLLLSRFCHNLLGNYSITTNNHDQLLIILFEKFCFRKNFNTECYGTRIFCLLRRRRRTGYCQPAILIIMIFIKSINRTFIILSTLLKEKKIEKQEDHKRPESYLSFEYEQVGTLRDFSIIDF